MSSGATQVCRRMGIADAIAIKITVTAKIFAMTFRSPKRVSIWLYKLTSRPPHYMLWRPPVTYLFRLKGEIPARGFSRCHGHFLRLSTQVFLPSCDRVTSGRNAVNGISAAVVGGGVWPFHYRVVAVHPGMNVAFNGNHFRCLPALHDRRRSRRLRFVPGNVPRHWIRQRMNVVSCLVAGGDFEVLASIHRQNVRDIHATLLVKRWRA